MPAPYAYYFLDLPFRILFRWPSLVGTFVAFIPSALTDLRLVDLLVILPRRVLLHGLLCEEV